MKEVTLTQRAGVGQVESIIGCPDGAEVCKQCFDTARY